ncbi:MAG: glycosyltransferase family 2 protein [Thermoanaerobaculales bacterium]
MDRVDAAAARRVLMKLSVVVPSWNGGELLNRNLKEVVAQARALPGGAEVLIVDDGSNPSDGTPAAVDQAGDPARLVRRPEHKGFAAACNAGAGAAGGEYLAFLNNDVRPEAGCLATLVETIEGRGEVFAVVPYSLNAEAGTVESAVQLRIKHGVFDIVYAGRAGVAPAPGKWREVAYPCGGAFLCRRSVFFELGGFAALYAPFYWEDADLGWRARRAGLAVIEVSGARVRHEHSRTIGVRFPHSTIRTAFERNRLLFTWTHLGGARPWLVHLAWLPLRFLAAVLRADAPWALPKALVMVARVVAARRHLRESRRQACWLVGQVVGSGRDGFPRGGNSAALARVSE